MRIVTTHYLANKPQWQRNNNRLESKVKVILINWNNLNYKSFFLKKCRWMIEKQNGRLKNIKSLDIRNFTLGHIQIDYSIACAMWNFDHKRFRNCKEQ